MEATEARAVMGIALMAALADGRNGERERTELRRVAEALGGKLDVAAMLTDALARRLPLQSLTSALTTPELRRLAFELAVGVCDADGLRNDAETRFLAELGHEFGLDQPAIVETAVAVDQFATASLPAESPASPPQPTSGNERSADQAELDRLILDAAVLNGALELLPQSLATIAIIPLQMRLVHRIGRAYGAESDKLQIRELLATFGAGVTGQFVEQIGRRLIAGVFGQGGLLGSLGGSVTGAAFSFATTYAIGEMARRYYASGRTMSADLLRQSFAELLEKGRALQAQWEPRIREQARQLDAKQLTQLLQ